MTDQAIVGTRKFPVMTEIVAWPVEASVLAPFCR